MERFDATLRIALSQMQNLQTTICPYCTSSNPHFSRLCATCGSRLQNTILPIGLRLKDGFYELEGVLGQGGFGITYLARHTGLGTKVALKELYPDNLVMRDSSGKVRAQAGMQPEFESLKIRFSREAKTLRELNHKCSTKFISDWEERGTVFIAMEFIDGETLESRIARGALLTEREAREVMLPILELLEVVHSKGLLHRDIKPANIILTKNGGVELIDFGSVTKFSANQRSKITSRLLTPAYAPLEQYGQEVMLTPSTDLYALAATMYEAVTGKAPPNALERANGAMMYLARLVEPTISREFSEVLDKALELRMEDRYSSAVEFLFGLSSIKSSLSQIVKTSQSPMRQHVPQYLQNSSKFSRNQKTFDIPNYRIFIYGLFIFLILLYKIISPTISYTINNNHKIQIANMNSEIPNYSLYLLSVLKYKSVNKYLSDEEKIKLLDFLCSKDYDKYKIVKVGRISLYFALERPSSVDFCNIEVDKKTNPKTFTVTVFGGIPGEHFGTSTNGAPFEDWFNHK